MNETIRIATNAVLNTSESARKAFTGGDGTGNALSW
jgi:hypothetical protein